MSDSQKIPPHDASFPDPLDDPRLTALALGELSSGDVSLDGLALDDDARREVDEIARFADSLGAALRTDEAGLDSGRRAAILAASMGGATKQALVLPLPAARSRVLRRVVQWSAGGAVAAGLALTVAPHLLEARKHGNEAAAIGALRTTNSAETLFREGDKEQNGNLDYGNVAAISNTTLIDGVLGARRQQGYTFNLKPSGASGEPLWFANANPNAPTSTGDRYFATNHAGVIYYTHRGSVALGDQGQPIQLHSTRTIEVDRSYEGSYVTPGYLDGERTETTAATDAKKPVYDNNGRFLGYDTNGDHRADTDLAAATRTGDVAGGGATPSGGGFGGGDASTDEIDDLRREKNDLQDGNIELERALEMRRLQRESGGVTKERARLEREFSLEQARILSQDAQLQSRVDGVTERRYRPKVRGPGGGLGPLPGLGAPGPEALPGFVRLNALTGPTSAPHGDQAAYEGLFGANVYGIPGDDTTIVELGQGRLGLFGRSRKADESTEYFYRSTKAPLGDDGNPDYGITFDNGSTTNGLGVNGFFPYDPTYEKDRVDRLLKRSLDQLSLRRFDGAERTLAGVLALDPTNEEALKLRALTSEARALVELGPLAQGPPLTEGPNAGDLEVPYFPYGRVEFPDKVRWMKLRARDVGVAAPDTRTPEWIRDYAQVLRTRKVTLNFAETPFGEVVSFLQDITGLNIEVAREVDQEKTLVSLRLKDIPLQDALRLVLEQTKLGVNFQNETLRIGPGGAKGLPEALAATGASVGDYELSSGGVGVIKIEIDGIWYDLPTSAPAPTAATTLEGLYTNGWRPTPLIETRREAQSTFAVDVDTASYARVRHSIQVQNTWPAAGTVRVEELVNYHEYSYPAPTDGRPIAASSEVTTCPWAPDRRLVRIGLRGRGLEGAARPAANLVFLIDVSGSMGSVEKLPLVQRALTLLVAQLGAQDKVSIVVYAGASGCVLDGVSGADKGKILGALERLQSGGSTNGGAGIELAYELASRRFVEGGVNRVILCTDGDWNVGAQSQQALQELIARKARGHVQLTALGFGMSEGGDKTLETLADRGDGNYAYVDGLPEARRVLVEQLDGTLVTIGKDVKVQVEWDPAAVTGYTLVGYEDRRLENRDFANDAKDAGDVGARHAVTALYEVKLAPGAKTLGTLRLRWKAVKAGQAADTSELLELPLVDDGRTLEKTSTDTRFAMGVAAFALGLKAGPGPGQQLLGVAQALVDGARAEDPHGLRADLSELVRKARGLGR